MKSSEPEEEGWECCGHVRAETGRVFVPQLQGDLPGEGMFVREILHKYFEAIKCGAMCWVCRRCGGVSGIFLAEIEII